MNVICNTCHVGNNFVTKMYHSNFDCLERVMLRVTLLSKGFMMFAIYCRPVKMFPNRYTTTPPPRYGYNQQPAAGYVYDQAQLRFAAPGQYFVQALGATPPQLYQMVTVTQDQPPPGYPIQQYYPQVQPVTPPIQHYEGLAVQTPVNPVTPVAQTSTSTLMPEPVDNKTEPSENKQNDKDNDRVNKEPESPLAQTLTQEDSNGDSIYLKLTKSDLEKPEWKWLLVNYSTNDGDKPDKTDQGPQTVKPNEALTVTNISQQMPPVAPPMSVTQPMPPVSILAVQPVPTPVPPMVPPVMGQPMYYSALQYISGPDVFVQTAVSLLQPKNMP